MLPERLKRRDTAEAAQQQMVLCGNCRFTVLTDRLLRIEFAPDAVFEDRGTQSVVNRQFPETPYRLKRDSRSIQIETGKLTLYWEHEAALSALSVTVHTMPGNPVWHWGDEVHTLKGTCRTLDGYPVESNGELGEGVCSRNGYSVLEDGGSLIVNDEGWVEQRPDGVTDIYFFGYGHDYIGATRALYALTGLPPLLPHYVFGNWWSRFYSYDEESYLSLMDRFRKEDIPFTVAVIDMDWHWAGSGFGKDWRQLWTGYSWNRRLFPDYRHFLNRLHERGLHPSLNLHPARGVQDHEDMYKEMAIARGIDPDTKKTVNFEPADPSFWDPYLSIVHHPYEKDGVDFWWMDWQQGRTSDMPGLDPLWALNHFHALDCARGDKRPMFFSRYAGPGSQRFYVGFSGDTYICWESLKYEPYFTATAANIGYPYWSHDIGGFQQGKRDDELYIRWIQFGVFSPISRLHCSNNAFLGKVPWNYDPSAEKVAKQFLRLRHQLFPYLYSMNHRTHMEGRALCEPLYYRYPEEAGAYEFGNEYFFGTEMLVCPVTEPMDERTRLAETDLWLPEGQWIDWFTGVIYTGGRRVCARRALNSIPVFCQAGAIVPMQSRAEGDNAVGPAMQLELVVFAGKSNRFTLYEDEGVNNRYMEGHFAETLYEWQWTDEKACFVIHPTKGDANVLPVRRDYTLRFRALPVETEIRVLIDGLVHATSSTYEPEMDSWTITLFNVPVNKKVMVEFTAEQLCLTDKGSRQKTLFDILLYSHTENEPKADMWQFLSNDAFAEEQRLEKLFTYRQIEPLLVDALEEVLKAQKQVDGSTD